MKFVTFEKPVMQNGRFNIDNYYELLKQIIKANEDYNILFGELPKEHSVYEWDQEDGFHYIMIDFLNGSGCMLQQRGNDYRLAP